MGRRQRRGAGLRRSRPRSKAPPTSKHSHVREVLSRFLEHRRLRQTTAPWDTALPPQPAACRTLPLGFGLRRSGCACDFQVQEQEHGELQEGLLPVPRTRWPSLHSGAAAPAPKSARHLTPPPTVLQGLLVTFKVQAGILAVATSSCRAALPSSPATSLHRLPFLPGPTPRRPLGASGPLHMPTLFLQYSFLPLPTPCIICLSFVLPHLI